MKIVLSLIFMSFLVVACGSDGGGSKSDNNPPADPDLNGAVFSVASVSDLPTCNSDFADRIYWVDEQGDFYRCSSLWQKLNVGRAVENNYIISLLPNDLCNDFANDSCFFNGGQFVKYHDGSVYFSGSFLRIYNEVGDTDVIENTIGVLFPPQFETGYIVLSEFVARGGSGFANLFLVFDKTASGNLIQLWHDSDDDGILEATDEQIPNISVSDW